MKKITFILLFILTSITSFSQTPTQNEIQKLLASDGTSENRFGHSVSISADRAVVGSVTDDDNGTNSGSAYVFEFNNGLWIQTAKLTASDGAANDQFGGSVSISGDKIIIGARFEDNNGSYSGSAYIFEFYNGVWNETKLTPSNGAGNDSFGNSVSISGNKAIVGAFGKDNRTGSAYVYQLINGTWTETEKFKASDAEVEDNFGFSVSISGDKAIVGSYRDDDNLIDRGSAYIYELSNGNWNETKIIASDAVSGDHFGWSVSISGDKAIVGSYRFTSVSNISSAYIYELNNGSWNETKISATDGVTGDRFGSSVSISGNKTIVGSHYDDDNGTNSGSAYIFELSNGSWTESLKLNSSDGAISDFFGSSVSINDDIAFVGALEDDDKGNRSGSAYIFSTSNNLDTTPPTITLTGNNLQTIIEGNAYSELGATANDDTDGDITNNIIIDASNVNTNVIGSYTVTYNVQDASGNNATEVTRTVNVVSNPNFYLDANGVTCKCENAAIGESGTLVINGFQKTFTKRTEQQLRDLINNDINDVEIELTCTSGITNMYRLFFQKTLFNQNLNNWDVKDVTNMNGMFAFNSNFNGNIENWNVENVEDMSNMFGFAYNFNSNISQWNVAKVTNMNAMFFDCQAFNQNIGNWNVSNVGGLMQHMFNGTSSFNQNLNGWCVTFNFEPNGFSSNSALQESNKPIWGTCPGNVSDSNPPTISLTGADPQIIEVGETYTELGATANDDLDGDISANIAVDANNVDTSVVGSYTVTYDVSDAAGNDAVQVSRTVNVVDTTAPVITLTGANPQVIELGDNYLELGATANDNLDGDISSNISVDNSQVNINNPGTYFVTYNVSDAAGNKALEISRIVNVIDPNAFVTRWKTTNSNESITIPTTPGNCSDCYDYFYTVNWGDGTVESGIMNNATHTYSEPGEYIVSITGTFPRIKFGDNPNIPKTKIIELIQWGSIRWSTMSYAFTDCQNLHINAKDIPDLSNVTDVLYMLSNVGGFDSDFNSWDVSNIQIMKNMFTSSDFNLDISNWKVSNVYDMTGMFQWTNFNQDIGNWNVSNVGLMTRMFQSNFVFNQDISNWNVSNVIDMEAMFFAQSSNPNLYSEFNQNLGNWNISKVTDLSGMFFKSKMSVYNYDQTLIGWSNRSDLNQNVVFGADNLIYCNSEEARKILEEDFNWQITDSGKNCDGNTPTSLDDSASAIQNGGTITITVLDNDDFGIDGPNATHPLTFSNGSLNSASINGGTISIFDNNTPNDLSDDVILYTPPTGFVGEDNFVYVITDANGNAVSATVTITVNDVGEVIIPTAIDDTAIVGVNSSNNTIDVLVNDIVGLDGFIDGGLTATNGTLQSGTTEGGLMVVDDKNTPETTDDKILYTPKQGFIGVDTFQYTITDASGDAATATVTITVGNANIPIAVDDEYTVQQNSTDNLLNIIANDFLGNNGGKLVSVTSRNTTIGNFILDSGDVQDPTDDVLRFTPLTNFTGTSIIEYTLSNDNGDTATATVTVTVTAAPVVNGTPTAVDDTATVVQDSTNNLLNVLINDDYGTDGANATHPITFSNGSTSNASSEGGAVSIVDDNGVNKISYSPAKDFVGTDTISYIITDASGDASTATVTVTVTSNGVVSTPTAVDDSASVAVKGSVEINVLANDSSGSDGYADGGLTMTNGTLISASTKGGAISIDNKGTLATSDDVFNYTAFKGAIAGDTDTFQYTITDVSGDASTATVTVTITAAATDVPTAVDDTATATENTAETISVLTNDSFGTDLRATAPNHLTVGGTSTNGGTTVVSGDDIIYTPATDFKGVDTFTYTIEDSTGDTSTATVTVTVSHAVVVNGTPTAVDDVYDGDDGFDRYNWTSSDPIIYLTVLDNDDFGTDGAMTAHNALNLINGKIDEVSAQGRRVRIDDNGTPTDYSDDRIAYYATSNLTVTSDSFTYYITDNSGDATLATVTINYIDVAPPKTGDTTDKDENTVDSGLLVSNEFTAYPNPSQGRLTTAVYSKENTKAILSLYDIRGVEVYRGQLELKPGKNVIENEFRVKSGVMFLKIYNSETNYGIKKIVFK